MKNKTYNPSYWTQRFPIALFIFICFGISLYLALYQFGYIHSVWDPFFKRGSQIVLESDLSPLYGVVIFFLELLLTCLGSKTRWKTSPWLVIVFGIFVVPLALVSIFLIIIQPLIYNTWCTLCLLTALCMLIPIPLAIDEIVAAIQSLRHKKGTFDDRKTSFRLLGLSFPYNLIATLCIGIILMTEEQLDPMLGCLTIAISVISFSEHIRWFRFLNILTAILILFFSLMIEGNLLFHAIIAMGIIALSIRKGPIDLLRN